MRHQLNTKRMRQNNLLKAGLLLGFAYFAFVPDAVGQTRGNRSARVYKVEQKANLASAFDRKYPALPAEMPQHHSTLLTPPASFMPSSGPKTARVVTYDGTELVGNMIYASSITTSDISLYSFPVMAGTAQLTNITGGKAFRANGGGIYSEDKTRYYLVEYVRDTESQKISSLFAELNTDDWSIVRSKQLPDNDGSLLATDLTRDPVSHQVYGVFLSKNLSSLELGVINYDSLTRTTIGTLNERFVALAADGSGQLWGIATDGNLYKINKETTATTKVGALGITVSSYSQSATFYNRKGILYYSQFNQGSSALYEVNTQTGAATLATTYPNNSEIVALEVDRNGYDQAAPAKPQDMKVEFNSPAKTAKVEFTVPTVTAADSALTGSVTYHIMTSDGQDISGQASVGSKVSRDITFTASGRVRVSAYLSNDKGDGPSSDTFTGWMGPDQPQTVGGAQFTLTDNKYADLTWKAPQKGVNGGSIDTTQVEYDITRQPDGKTFKIIGLTSLKDTINPKNTAFYYYDIKAFYGGVASEVASSNKIKVNGPAFEVPYADDFSTEEDFKLFDVKDLDEDGVTWGWNDMLKCASAGFASTQHHDLLVSPAIHLYPGKYYRISYDVKGLNSQYTEKYRVTWGNDGDDPVNYTDEITPETSTSAYKYDTKTKIITVDKERNIRLAFWALSDANQGYLYLDNVKVDLVADFQAPAQPQITKAQAGAQGALTASIAFTLPTKTAHGEALTAIDSADVVVDGVHAKTFAAVTPGQTLTATVDVTASGYHQFVVNCYNIHGKNSSDTTIYVGTDVPQAPQDITLADMGDYLQLNWSAPGTVGARGGYVNTAGLTYNIGSSESTSGNEAEGISATSYQAHPNMSGSQRMAYYGVQAHNAEGSGNWGLSNYTLIGDAYKLPFKESFPGQNPSYGIWVINDQDASIASSLSQDNDNGAMVLQSDRDSVITLESGKIALGNATSPMLSFWMLNHASDSKLNIRIAENGGKEQLVKTLQYDSTLTADTWRKVVVPLADYKGSRYIRIEFEVQNNKKTLTAIDNIAVEDRYLKDVTLNELNVPNEITAGDSVFVVATLENKGLDDLHSAPLSMEVNGKVMATEDVDVASGETISKEFKFKSNAAMPAQSVIKVSADVADDGHQDDNQLSANFNVKTLDLPTVTDLTGELVPGSDDVKLTWSKPNYVAPVVTTENFDSYEPWTLNLFGGWTSVNANPGTACATFANGTTFTHSGEEFASIIFKPEVNGGMKAHSGDNCVAVFDNDGWGASEQTNKYLISPELSGDAQTISMWMTNAEQWMPESYSIMYSTTGTDVADFKDAGVSAMDKDFSQQWTEITADLPAGAKYFAIHVTSTYSTALLIDDITYSPAKTAAQHAPMVNQIEGYNVYKDSVMVNSSLVTDTTYQMPVGNYTGILQVSTVYTKGESALGNLFDLTTTAINATPNRQATVKEIYDARGMRLQNMQKGVNIVLMSDGSWRKIVRR